jgi:hypothetical protein
MEAPLSALGQSERLRDATDYGGELAVESTTLTEGEPHVVLPGGKVSITESAGNLYNLVAPKHQLFIRGKQVVSLSKTITGQLVLEPLRPSAARSLFETFARFFVWRMGKDGKPVLKPCVMPEETARALLDCHVAADLLPPINGVVSCPLIVEIDGQLVICGKGYDRRSGILVVEGGTPEDVPLTEAVGSLCCLLREFDFQSPSDYSRAVAAFIAPALRMGNLINGHIPVDIAEADQSQSGKTYRQKLVAALYGETPAVVPQKRSGVGGIDESFFEKLVNGRPFIQFDNYRGSLDSPALEAFLTSTGSFPCRIPHCREIEVDPSRFMVMLTSNGVETTRDLANRASIVRIRKRPNVQFEDTLGEVINRKRYYLSCVFAIAREWYRKGKPRTKETRHDFREWCQSLDWIVQNICGLTPLMDGHVPAQERVSNPALTFLRRIALEVERAELLAQPLIASRIVQMADDADVPVPGLKSADAHDEDRARKVLGTKMASVFRNQEKIELDGFIITRNEVPQSRPSGGDFNLKAYTFTRISAATQ